MQNILVSKSFYLADLCTSETAIRHGLLNVPGPVEIAALKALAANVLEPVNHSLGPIHVTSAYRADLVNRATGGAATSQHVAGQAADIVKPGWTAAHLFNAMQLVVKSWDQIILEYERWVHVSYRADSKNRMEKLRVDMVDGKPLYKVIS